LGYGLFNADITIPLLEARGYIQKTRS